MAVLTETIAIEMDGRVTAQCPGGPPTNPETVTALVICRRPIEGEGPDNALEQLPYTCRDDELSYGPQTGFYQLDCAPPFPTDSCDGRLSIFLQMEFADRDGPYVVDVSGPRLSQCQ